MRDVTDFYKIARNGSKKIYPKESVDKCEQIIHILRNKDHVWTKDESYTISAQTK